MPQLAEGTFFWGLLIVGIGLAFVLAPYVIARRGNSYAQAKSRQKRDALITTYERILSTIRDLDEDFVTGKLAEATYQEEREYWAKKGTQLLSTLQVGSGDVAPMPAKPAKTNANADEVLDDAIESAIQQYMQAQSGD